MGGDMRVSKETIKSQSPYGAKWFATEPCGCRVCKKLASRNPLTGLSGLQLDKDVVVFEDDRLSQSPYGAKWFATLPP